MKQISGIGQGPILVIAAHADDEALGCGGTIARLAELGQKVHVMFMTDGVSARGSGDAEARRHAALDALSLLGAQQPVFGEFPDNAMDTVPLIEVARAVEEVVASLKPSCILTHHHGDLNIDHQIVNRAVMTACRPQPEHCVQTILSFSVRSSTEWGISSSSNLFHPDVYIDIAHVLPKKIKALQCYSMEMRHFPHTRSIEAVEMEAKLVGARVGMNAAEGFKLLRMLVRDE